MFFVIGLDAIVVLAILIGFMLLEVPMLGTSSNSCGSSRTNIFKSKL